MAQTKEQQAKGFIEWWPKCVIVLMTLKSLIRNRIARIAISIVIGAGDGLYESLTGKERPGVVEEPSME